VLYATLAQPKPRYNGQLMLGVNFIEEIYLMILALLFWLLTIFLAHYKGYPIIYWVFSLHIGWIYLIFINPLSKYNGPEIEKQLKKVNNVGFAFSIVIGSITIFGLFEKQILSILSS
jgi:energy-coupling factor transporter transmembrane protein EcfT